MIQDTSLDAFSEIIPELGERQLQVFKAIEKLEFSTNAMISQYLKLPINSITPRTHELRKKNLFKKSHISWCPVTKHRAIYWKTIHLNILNSLDNQDGI